MVHGAHAVHHSSHSAGAAGVSEKRPGEGAVAPVGAEAASASDGDEEGDEVMPLSSLQALLRYVWKALPDWIYWQCLEIIFGFLALQLAKRSRVLRRLFETFDWLD
jgi:hypothetical protein